MCICILRFSQDRIKWTTFRLNKVDSVRKKYYLSREREFVLERDGVQYGNDFYREIIR